MDTGSAAYYMKEPMDSTVSLKLEFANILEEANKIIYGDREQTYGHPAKNLTTISEMWNAYLRAVGLLNDGKNIGLTAEDICNMMVLLKVARLANNPEHHDSQVDICGYTALLERIQKHNKIGINQFQGQTNSTPSPQAEKVATPGTCTCGICK